MSMIYPLNRRGKAKFFYNVVMATLWICCFGRFLVLLPLVGKKFLPGGIADFFHTVATLSALGVVAVPSWNRKRLWLVFNETRMIWLCYGVIFPHPRVAKHTSYSILIVSWCLDNLINSLYYGFKSKTRTSPHWLFWLKYHKFWIFFPLSMGAEMVLVFLSLGYAEGIYDGVLQAALLAYIPVAYFQWGYNRQRKVDKYDTAMAKLRYRKQAIAMRPMKSGVSKKASFDQEGEQQQTQNNQQ